MSATSPRTAAVLLIVGALLGGIVIGGAGDRAYLIWRHRILPPPNAMRRMSEHIVNRLDDQLHFSPQQRVAVQQIIDRHRQRIEAIWASVRPQTRQEIDATNAEIERVLTPEQQAKFRDMRARHQQQHEHRMMRPPH